MTVRSWLQEFRFTYSIVSGDLMFNAWPDGECLYNQEEIRLVIFQIIKNEFYKEKQKK